jgi:hypothetical protein
MDSIKKICYLVLIFLFLIVGSDFHIFALITSRVEGIVTDIDTGLAIADVEVHLVLDYGIEPRKWRTKTDRNGYFKFDHQIYADGYYIQCYKKGYIPFLPEYYRSVKDELFAKIFRVFDLKEGQIKHIRIKLERGGTLKGVLYKKELSGVTIFKNVSMFLGRKKDADEYVFPGHVKELGNIEVKTNEKGEFEMTGLEPSDEYFIEFLEIGYRYPTFRNIKIRKNEVTNIDFTVDFTDQTGIKGVIKINGEIPQIGSVYLKIITNNNSDLLWSCRSYINDIGEYSCFGLLPGKYEMDINLYYSEGKVTKRLIVEIEQGKTKTLDLNY